MYVIKLPKFSQHLSPPQNLATMSEKVTLHHWYRQTTDLYLNYLCHAVVIGIGLLIQWSENALCFATGHHADKSCVTAMC